MSRQLKKDKVLSSVKDKELVKKRRHQMIQGAMTLFKEKGFHRTTTREIAKESGFSIGTLYEYIRTKEDVLYLVCDSIYENFLEWLEKKVDLTQPSIENLIKVVQSYFLLMDEMQEEVLILYQEIKSLSKETQEAILKKERHMVSMLERVILKSFPDVMSSQDANLLANNIFIQGQMWGFRRWMLHRQFTLEDYINRQIQFLLSGMVLFESNDEITRYLSRQTDIS